MLNTGRKSEEATSLLPSQGPKPARNGYLTATFLGVSHACHMEKIRLGYFTPAFSGDPNPGGMVA